LAHGSGRLGRLEPLAEIIGVTRSVEPVRVAVERDARLNPEASAAEREFLRLVELVVGERAGLVEVV